MFGTQMHWITFVILIGQVLVLFAQLLFYLSRPNDRSRLRFLILIATFILHNVLAGLLPDPNIPLSIFIQNILTYGGGIVAAIYLIYYIYVEFRIFPFKFLRAKPLSYIMGVSFLVSFIIPYYFSEDLQFSKRIFLSIALLLSLIFLVHLGSVLLQLFKKKEKKRSKYFKHRVIAGFLGLLSITAMIITVILGDYQGIQQSIMNFGLTAIITTHILEFITHRREEALVLKKLQEKEESVQIQLAKGFVEDVLLKFEKFEQDKQYLVRKITLFSLAKNWNTNSKYLSQIVNTRKGKSFTQYINDLRIDHFKERLRTDEKFRKYTLIAIANELGFSSPQVFARAFYKKEQIKLNDYLKKN